MRRHLFLAKIAALKKHGAFTFDLPSLGGGIVFASVLARNRGKAMATQKVRLSGTRALMGLSRRFAERPIGGKGAGACASTKKKAPAIDVRETVRGLGLIGALGVSAWCEFEALTWLLTAAW
jgi:hypothetical protein